MLNFVYHRDYSYPFPDNHRFAMSKFHRLYRLLSREGVLDQVWLNEPEKASIEDISLIHQRDYVQALADGTLTQAQLKRLRLPWSPELANRSFIAANGTYLTCQLALEHGLALHMAGGTHHSQPEGGAGFCVFNDMAYATVRLLQSQRVGRVLILDCDVHQGDGTANILRGVPGAFTCSLHCQQNYPHPKAVSDLDVPIQAGCEDSEYLELLARTLDTLMTRFAPDLVIYDAGADVHEQDQLGHLKLTRAGMEARDQLVFERCHQEGVAVAVVIGGGYAADREALVDLHAIPFRTAVKNAGNLGLRLRKTVA